MSEFIEVISKQSLEQIDKLIEKLNIVTEEVKQFNDVSKKIKVPSEATEQIKKTTKATQKLTEAQKEAKRLARALERQKEKLAQATSKENKELLKLRYETQKTNREQKQMAIISSRLSNEYEKQQAKINLLSNRYRELATRQELGIKLSKEEEKELKDVTRQINRKQTALKKVDANMKVYNRNVGNYKSAWKGVGGLLMASVTAFGAFEALQIGKEIFSQVKEIDALNKALKQVTSSQNDFNQSIDFLTSLADEAGADINTLQRAYTKFRASANSTNLTIGETQRIFRAVAKTGGLLGLQTEQLEGAFRALEQMLSKGKVQAEEIRGQLGERLPGAFQILAKSMGLTTAELSKQLELGNVYAEEVLPKFAKELEKTYNLANTKVETLTASQIRMGNAWNQFIREIESGGGIITKAFKGIFDFITNVIQGMTWMSDAYGRFIDNMKFSINPIKTIKNQAFAMALSFVRVKNEIQNASNATKILNKILQNTDKPLENVKTSLNQVNKGLKANERNMIIANDLLKEYRNGNIELSKMQEAFIINTFKENDALQAKQKVFKNYLQTLKQSQGITEKAKEQAKEQGEEIAKSIKEGIEKGDPLDVYRQMVARQKELKEITDGVLNGLEEVPEDYTEMNKTLERSVELMKQLADESKKAFQKDLIIGELNGLLGMLNMDVGVLSSTYETLADKSSTAFEKQIALADGVGEIVNGIGQTIFQNEQIRLQNQLALNSEYYNEQIRLAEGNQLQQEFLRNEQAAKERELRIKQAENEKKNAKFQIGIETAVAVIKTFAKLGFTPAGIKAAALLAGIGIAKAALVASRPIPQFKKGRKGGPETWAILGDGYKNEPIIDKKGNLKAISPNKPTMMHLDKGDSVLPNMDLLNDKILLANVQASANRMIEQNQNKGLERMLQAQSSNIERSIIKSLKKAKFVNVNNTKVDLGFEFKKQKYKGI